MYDNVNINILSFSDSSSVYVNQAICGNSNSSIVNSFNTSLTRLNENTVIDNSSTATTLEKLAKGVFALHYTCFSIDKIKNAVFLKDIIIKNILTLNTYAIYLGDSSTREETLSSTATNLPYVLQNI